MYRTIRSVNRCMGLASKKISVHGGSFHLCRFSENRLTRTGLSLALQETQSTSLDLPRTRPPRSETDPLSQTIRSCKSLPDILDVLSTSLREMRSYHYLKCFDVIENLARSQDLKDILNSADFNELCSKTLRSLKFSDKNAGITVLGCLVRLEVSPKVTLVSAALQVIRNELNSLDVDDIIFLDYLLKLMTGKESKTSGVPLADALKIALPIVLELKIGNKDVDFNDPTEMCKCLRMAAFKRIRADKINMLMNALHRLQGQLTTDHCYWISVSLKARYIARAPIDHDLAKTLFDYCVREVAKKDVFRDHEDNEDL